MGFIVFASAVKQSKASSHG